MAEHGGTWRNGDRWDRSGPAIFVSFTLRMFQGPFDSKMRCLGRWFWNNDNDHACGDENGFNHTNKQTSEINYWIDYLVGGFKHFLFSIIYGKILPID